MARKNCKTCVWWGSMIWHDKYRICTAQTETEAPVMSKAEYGCCHWQKREKEDAKRG